MHPSVDLEPPVGSGTISLTGRSGKAAWAPAGHAAATQTAAAAAISSILRLLVVLILPRPVEPIATLAPKVREAGVLRD